MDYDLLQLIKNRENFLRFQPYIKEHTLSKEGQKLLASIDRFFKDYPAVDTIDWTALETAFFAQRSGEITKLSAPTYKNLFNKLRTEPPTIAAHELLNNYITHDYAARVLGEAIKAGDANFDVISDLVKQYDKEVDRAINKSDVFVTDDQEVALPTDEGLPWRLEELNISCGPLRQGDFVIVGARPESGKTTFLASEVSYMASRMKDERPVLWVNNEERSTKVKRRIIQAALGIDLKEYMKDQALHKARYKMMMKMDNRILITGSSSGTNSVSRLIPLLRDLNPGLIVFDQLDKVAGFERKNDKEDQRLGGLYEWARSLSHEYGPVITASQANDSAEGEQWIYQNQLRGSRTDKAGEADAIITIGKKHSDTPPEKRYIHVPKNKLDGGPRSDEKLRHGFWEVLIKPEIGRFEGTK